MRQMTLGKVLSAMACVLMLCSSTSTIANQAQYIHDDLGKLSQVIDGQENVATYTYAVGNLLSITRSMGGVGAPTITSFGWRQVGKQRTSYSGAGIGLE